MSSSKKQTSEEESRSKWSKESDQRVQRRGNNNKEFLGKCFKCGEIGHRSFECLEGSSKGIGKKNCMTHEEQVIEGGIEPKQG